MVLNNLAKFHKILIKSIRLRERTSFQIGCDVRTDIQTYVYTDGRAWVTLNALAGNNKEKNSEDPERVLSF